MSNSTTTSKLPRLGAAGDARCSTLLAGQLPVSHWHECIGDPTIADAICDRLVHNAHQLTLTGGSLRKTRTGLTSPSACDK